MNSHRKFSVSFELYPPANADNFCELALLCEKLSVYQPGYFSVTFGAGGSAQFKTKQFVSYLRAQQFNISPHISCVNMTREKISELLEEYKHLKINHLVVIRGDADKTNTIIPQQDFVYANELVTYIRKIAHETFSISVAAYPEAHPESINPAQDLDYFKNKLANGANNAITQYFYNTDAFLYFRDDCRRIGIEKAIIPGILPIKDFQTVLKFSSICGAEIPLWIKKRFQNYANDHIATQEIGIEIVTSLCEKLLTHGVDNFHFYTLNNLEPTKVILENLGMKL